MGQCDFSATYGTDRAKLDACVANRSSWRQLVFVRVAISTFVNPCFAIAAASCSAIRRHLPPRQALLAAWPISAVDCPFGARSAIGPKMETRSQNSGRVRAQLSFGKAALDWPLFEITISFEYETARSRVRRS